MFDSSYSTKEICQIFNIGRETLRHYERLGLLTPKINEKNGYRMYSYWDVCTIIDILKYRSFGMSLADAKAAMLKGDLPTMIDNLEIHTREYTDKIAQYKLLLDKTNRDLGYLRHAKDHLNEITETDTVDYLFIPYSPDPKGEYFISMREAFNNSQFFTTALAITDTSNGLRSYGLITEKKYADYLNIKKGIHIKKSRIVSQILDITGRNPLDESIVKDFKQHISGKYSRVFETIYAVLVSRFYDDERRYHQYVFVFAKID